MCRRSPPRRKRPMRDLNPEQVRRPKTLNDAVIEDLQAEIERLREQLAARGEALAAAQREIRKRDIELASWALTYNETRESQLEAALRLLELDPGNDRAMSWLRMMAGEHFEWEPARAALASLSLQPHHRGGGNVSRWSKAGRCGVLGHKWKIDTRYPVFDTNPP